MFFRRSPICLAGSAAMALLGVCSSLPVLHAQQGNWLLDGPAFSASADDLIKAAAAVPAEKFAEATVLFERDSYTIDAAGKVNYRHAMIYRIETQQGVTDWAETSIRWEPWHEKEASIRARVVRPDGKVSQLDPKTISDGPVKDEDDNVYTD